MLEDAVRYPTRGDDALETIAIGGILGLLGFLIVPVILIYGYLVRVIRAVSDGDDETPPSFDEWGDLLVDGLKAFVISAVYVLVPGFVFLLAVSPIFIIAGVSTNGGGGSSIASQLILLVVLAVAGLSLLALVAALYVVPAAIAAFATTGRFGAAFSFRRLKRIGTSGQYATAWVIALVITVIAGFVGGAAAATVVGAVLTPFVNFYANVASAFAIGRGVEEEPIITDERTAPVVS